MKIKLTLMALLLSVVPAFSATIHFVNVDGIWQNALPVDPSVVIDNSVDPRVVEWGTNPIPNKSQYLFSPNTPGDVDVPPSPSAAFVLGDFTHRNFLVAAPFLNTVELKLSISFTVDGGGVSGPHEFVYLFTHEETDNGLNPCPYGGPLGACSDRVTISNPAPTVISIDGIDYILNLSFLVGGLPVTSFVTLEDSINNAQIVGQFTTSNIPEPSTAALMGLALVALGVRRFRRAR